MLNSNILNPQNFKKYDNNKITFKLNNSLKIPNLNKNILNWNKYK